MSESYYPPEMEEQVGAGLDCGAALAAAYGERAVRAFVSGLYEERAVDFVSTVPMRRMPDGDLALPVLSHVDRWNLTESPDSAAGYLWQCVKGSYRDIRGEGDNFPPLLYDWAVFPRTQKTAARNEAFIGSYVSEDGSSEHPIPTFVFADEKMALRYAQEYPNASILIEPSAQQNYTAWELDLLEEWVKENGHGIVFDFDHMLEQIERKDVGVSLSDQPVFGVTKFNDSHIERLARITGLVHVHFRVGQGESMINKLFGKDVSLDRETLHVLEVLNSSGYRGPAVIQALFPIRHQLARNKKGLVKNTGKIAEEIREQLY